MRVDALNRCDVRELAFARVAYDVHQQPWNGVRVEGVDVRRGFAADFAAVLQFPCGQLRCRVGEVLSDDFVFAIVQFCVGPFERPIELAVGVGLAGVNLRSLGMDEQNGLQSAGNGDRIGNVGRGFVLRSVLIFIFVLGLDAWGDEGESEERDGGEQKSSHGEDCSAGEFGSRTSGKPVIRVVTPAFTYWSDYLSSATTLR